MSRLPTNSPTTLFLPLSRKPARRSMRAKPLLKKQLLVMDPVADADWWDGSR